MRMSFLGAAFVTVALCTSAFAAGSTGGVSAGGSAGATGSGDMNNSGGVNVNGGANATSGVNANGTNGVDTSTTGSINGHLGVSITGAGTTSSSQMSFFNTLTPQEQQTLRGNCTSGDMSNFTPEERTFCSNVIKK